MPNNPVDARAGIIAHNVGDAGPLSTFLKASFTTNVGTFIAESRDANLVGPATAWARGKQAELIFLEANLGVNGGDAVTNAATGIIEGLPDVYFYLYAGAIGPESETVRAAVARYPNVLGAFAKNVTFANVQDAARGYLEAFALEPTVPETADGGTIGNVMDFRPKAFRPGAGMPPDEGTENVPGADGGEIPVDPG